MNLRLLAVSILVLGLAAAASAQQWLDTQSPTRVLYVAPGANGNGTSSNPMGFSAAISSAAPGDLIWLRQGTYAGVFRMSRSGTASKPIVVRAVPGENVVVDGAIDITGDHVWLWGLEVTDPNNRASSLGSGVTMNGAGVHLINNVIHHQHDKNGIAAWNAGPGQVIYGNIVYENGQGSRHPHNIYTQNDYNANGWKYIVGNVLLDSSDVCGDCFNFHAYTEGSYIKGFHVQENVIADGRFLIGGYNAPADREVLYKNYFYRANVQFGYARPTQVQFQNNYLGRSSLDTQWFWGAGETQYSQPGPNVYTGNEIYYPSGSHIRFRTSAYLSSGRCEGCPRIRSGDVLDGNRYSSPFAASFHANNKNMGTLSFSSWQSATASAGKTFDANSAVVAGPTGPKVVLIPNDYEPGRAHLAIYNWGRASQVSVSLSPVVSAGGSYTIYPVKDLYGRAAASGTYNGSSVNLPVSGDEFSVFVVVSKGGSGSTGTPAIVNPKPGSKLTSTTAQFEWSANGAKVLEWALVLAPAPGKTDIYRSGSLGTRTSVTVSGLPSNGSKFNARLKYRLASGWKYVDTQFTSATLATPKIVTPTAFSTLDGASSTFEWRPNGNRVTDWRLYVGSEVGRRNYWDSGFLGTSRRTTVRGLPTNGSVIYVRLWYRTQNVWKSVDYQYRAKR